MAPPQTRDLLVAASKGDIAGCSAAIGAGADINHNYDGGIEWDSEYSYPIWIYDGVWKMDGGASSKAHGTHGLHFTSGDTLLHIAIRLLDADLLTFLSTQLPPTGSLDVSRPNKHGDTAGDVAVSLGAPYKDSYERYFGPVPPRPETQDISVREARLAAREKAVAMREAEVARREAEVERRERALA